MGVGPRASRVRPGMAKCGDRVFASCVGRPGVIESSVFRCRSTRSVLFVVAVRPAVVRGTSACRLLRPVLLIGSGVFGFEAGRIEDGTFVEPDAEAARMTPQLLRAGLFPAGTRNFNGDECQKAGVLLENFIPAKAALNYHR
jgi:hypothetical protein